MNKTAYITEEKAGKDAFGRSLSYGFSITVGNRCVRANAKRYPTLAAAELAAKKKGLEITGVYLVQGGAS